MRVRAKVLLHRPDVKGMEVERTVEFEAPDMKQVDVEREARKNGFSGYRVKEILSLELVS